MLLFKEIRSFFTEGDERSLVVKRNAVGAFLIRAVSMVIDFAKVPVLLSYLVPENYGVYLTITSIVAWTHQFDFGLGTGLRYQLTAALSQNDETRGKQLVSTAYLSMASIMAVVLILCLPLVFSLDWNNILNTHKIQSNELILCVLLVLAVFLVQFVIELITIVLQADQKAAVSTLFKPIANVLTLLTIFVVREFSSNSLTIACLAMTVPILVVLLLANIYLFGSRYHSILPSFKDFRKDCLRDIYSLGLKYFTSQFSALIVFNTASFLISHFINPTETSVYNTAWTYFGVLVMFNNMLLTPLVAAVTDAFIKKDTSWIKHSYSKINKYCVLLSIASLIQLLVSPFMFHLWVGDKIIVPWSLSIVMTVFFICNIWSSPYQNFLTGVGKMNVMVIASFVKMIVFIPFAIVLIKLWGTVGLVVTILLVNTLPNMLLGMTQYSLIINNKARGIWNR